MASSSFIGCCTKRSSDAARAHYSLRRLCLGNATCPLSLKFQTLRLAAKGEGLVQELATMMRLGTDIYFRSLTEDRVKLLQGTLNMLLAHGDEAYRAVSAPNLRNRS